MNCLLIIFWFFFSFILSIENIHHIWTVSFWTWINWTVKIGILVHSWWDIHKGILLWNIYFLKNLKWFKSEKDLEHKMKRIHIDGLNSLYILQIGVLIAGNMSITTTVDENQFYLWKVSQLFRLYLILK